MSVEMSVLHIFFRVINSAVVFALIAYVFKRYVLDALKEQMREQEKQKQALIDAAQAFEQKRARVEQAAQEQVREAQQLRENVLIWQERFAHLCAQRETEKKALMDTLMRMSALQQEQITADALASRVFKRTCTQARADLRTHFAQEAAGKVYVNDVLTFIKKSAQ